MSVAYLKFFTFLERDGDRGARGATASAPEKREAQRVLAREVTTLVHGGEQVARAEHASSLLFGEDITTLPVDDVLAVFEDVPSTELPARRVRRRGHRRWSICVARVQAGAVEERGAAPRAVGRRVREQPPRVGSAGAAARASRRSAGGCSCCGRARSRIISSG